jgi:tetratricopeptide (TPR) repeat protein
MRALDVNPDFVEARLRLAELDIASGAFQAAISGLEGLIEKGHENPTIYDFLGAAYLGANDPVKAAALLKKSVEANPGDSRGQYFLGLALRNQGKNIEAGKHFEEALKISPGSVEPLVQLVSLDIAEDRLDTALERVTRQVRIFPSKPELYQILGRVYIARNETEKAETAYVKAIEIDPTFGSAYLALAKVYGDARKIDQAIAKVDEALKLDPKNITALMLDGILNQQRNDALKAQQAYEAVLSINPGFAPAANNLACIYLDTQGDIEKALNLAKTARDGAPEDPNVADTLGWTLYKKGNYDWALVYLQESAAKIPDNAEVQYHLGMAHYQLGNMDDAKKALNRALEIGPEFNGAPEAKRVLAELGLKTN